MWRYKHSVKAPSAWGRWELQADKTVTCGTQAMNRACGCYLPSVCSGTRSHVFHSTWRRGRGETPCVPHAPFKEMRTRNETGDRQALGPDETQGDDARLAAT